ncbi:MAG: 2'-5' RNA ligase family protein [Geminicoccaceae bacterium]
MAYAVELRFDEDLAERVRALWLALEQIGAGSFGPGSAPVPHMSLAVYDDEDEVDAAAASDLVAELAARGTRSEIAFASLGVFPTEENVLFLAPVVTPTLLDLHAAYHAMAQRLGATCRPYYLPGRWVPHCTLSMQGSIAGVQDGLGHLAARWKPPRGTIRSVALIKVPPLLTIAEHRLAGDGGASGQA